MSQVKDRLLMVDGSEVEFGAVDHDGRPSLLPENTPHLCFLMKPLCPPIILLLLSLPLMRAFQLGALQLQRGAWRISSISRGAEPSRRHFSAQSALGLTKVSVSDTFDGGNIQMGKQTGKGDTCSVTLQIKPDVFTELEKKSHSQYFCFRSTVSELEPTSASTVTYIVDNADKTSYPSAWQGSTVFYTTNLMDSDSWKRKLDTTYDNDSGNLSWTHTHEGNGSVYFSYFPPYSYSRHLGLIAKCTESPLATVQSLGQTLDGREMDCVQTGHGPLKCWIIHRQHPGEPMAEYYAEGLLHRLLGLQNGETDGLVQKLQELYTFYIVPNMCPDGAVRGHLRTNACGANLNREWYPKDDYDAPTLQRSPEVYHVLNKMKETGVDCFLDIHGDEELPFNFLSGAEGTDNWGPRLASLHGAFLAAYTRSNPDMQIKVGYDPFKHGEAPSNIGTNAIANRFDCLSATLEMPFKDCLSNPNPVRGWSPNRANMLGTSVLEPLAYISTFLRAEGEFWTALPAEDAYVAPSSEYDADEYQK